MRACCDKQLCREGRGETERCVHDKILPISGVVFSALLFSLKMVVVAATETHKNIA